MVIDISGLAEVMDAKGYNLEHWRTNYPLAVFGSRAAKCHHTNSDWDVVVLAPFQTADRSTRLDFLAEDPPNDSYWYARDLAFHLTGYAVWLSGAPNWDPALLQWDLALNRKLKRVREIALSLGKLTMAPMQETRWMRKCVEETGRCLQLRHHLAISPTSMLPKPTVEDFRAFGVDDSFLRRYEKINP